MQRSLSLPISIVGVTLPYVAFAELNGYFNGLLYELNPGLFWAVDAFFNVVFPALGFWFLVRFAGVRPARYGLAFPPPLPKELFGASIFFATILFAAYFIPARVVWAWSGYPSPYFSYGQVVPSGFARGPIVLYLALTAGIIESVIYIGLPWLLWRHLFGPNTRSSLFVWSSSAVFASVHWEQGAHGVIGAFVFGYVACRLYQRIADLWPIVGAHIAVDLVAFW